ncbi:carbohydrate kinase [Haloferula sp. BvORR071]|uniref:carbohydrate kinase family protein n=1 Tax=Haloferula sp. BvORR071 TaxID=1396141 RepID=UPI0005560C1C|nr:carbohydrate kinase [Haloferula sp. BvORR071]
MRPLVIGLGELLWDILPAGPRMGGAPANFACHAQALGARGAIVSSIGADDLGRRLLECLGELGVATDGIAVDVARPTGTVDVELGMDGQPCFTIREGVAWDGIPVQAAALELMAAASAVCFGTLGQRTASSRTAIRQLLQATPAAALRVFDVNLRQSFYSAELIHDSLELANVMKLSDSELPAIAELLNLRGSVREQLAALLERYQLRMIAYTRGADGSLLWDGQHWCEHAGLPATVKDTIGAGDSFTAATTLGMLQGWPTEWIAATANEVAAHVCSCVGAIPPIPEALRERFQWGNDQALRSA